MDVDWKSVKRVLVVRLRSIGDTVLATPSLIALKRFLPGADVDILLEDWVAPVLDGFDSLDRVTVTGDDFRSRLKAAREIRRRRYDVVFNLHGGPTSRLFVRQAAHGIESATRTTVGRRYTIIDFRRQMIFGSVRRTTQPSSSSALLGFVGVPVEDRPRSRLVVTESARTSLSQKFVDAAGTTLDNIAPFAVLHPAAAFETKQWDARNFARVADELKERGLRTVAVAANNERQVLDALQQSAAADIVTFDNLALPEITALASKAELFVGNDSGIAHMAAAVNTPSVVIFGSSNRVHWRPWTEAPHEIVFEEFKCQPCPGHECREFGEPRCILGVKPGKVLEAIDRVLNRR